MHDKLQQLNWLLVLATISVSIAHTLRFKYLRNLWLLPVYFKGKILLLTLMLFQTHKTFIHLQKNIFDEIQELSDPA